MFDSMITYDDGKMAKHLEIPGYFLDFHQGGDKLVVTFDSAAEPKVLRTRTRKPWGYDFFSKRGLSVLGVKPKQLDWYRGPDLHSFFRSNALHDLARRHSQIYLLGGSMGGYAALAFAEVFSGCIVIAFNPQFTLNAAHVPWEKRFLEGTKQDWSGDFADGRKGAEAAERVYVVYDPFYAPDRMHVERLAPDNLVRLKIPFIAHCVPLWMNRMGILGKTLESIFAGNLQEKDFRAMARARRTLPRYYTQIALRKPGSRLAKACAERALALDPKDRDALIAFCEELLHEKRYEEALSLKEQIQGFPGQELAVRAYLYQGMMKKASEVLSSALKSGNILGGDCDKIEKLANELGCAQIVQKIAAEKQRRS